MYDDRDWDAYNKEIKEEKLIANSMAKQEVENIMSAMQDLTDQIGSAPNKSTVQLRLDHYNRSVEALIQAGTGVDYNEWTNQLTRTIIRLKKDIVELEAELMYMNMTNDQKAYLKERLNDKA